MLLKWVVGYKYRNRDFGEVGMMVLGNYRGSTNCLDVVRGQYENRL